MGSSGANQMAFLPGLNTEKTIVRFQKDTYRSEIAQYRSHFTVYRS